VLGAFLQTGEEAEANFVRVAVALVAELSLLKDRHWETEGGNFPWDSSHTAIVIYVTIYHISEDTWSIETSSTAYESS